MKTPWVPTCKTCGFWGEDPDDGDDAGPMRVCHHPLFGYDEEDAELSGLRYEIDDGGDIKTGPNFGCVLYQPKERPLPNS